MHLPRRDYCVVALIALLATACGPDPASPFRIECGELPPTDYGEPSGRIYEPPSGAPPYDIVTYRYNCVIDGATFVEQRWLYDPDERCEAGEYGWKLDETFSRRNLNCT